MATRLEKNALTYLDRVIGNREPIGLDLTENDGTPINLTGVQTVKLRGVNMANAADIVIADELMTVVAPLTGRVSYEPTAAHVIAAKEIALYALVQFAGQQERRLPFDGARLILKVKSEVTTE